MKTTDVLNDKALVDAIKRSVATKGLLAVVCGALLTLLSSRADAQVYSLNAVGLVSDMTTQLLTTSLTAGQLQTLHAQNFNLLPTEVRPLYLHAVTYDVGITAGSGGRPLTSAALSAYLVDRTCYTCMVAQVEVSQPLLAHKTLVKEAMQELNTKISSTLTNDLVLQQAMESGAVNSYCNSLDGH